MFKVVADIFKNVPEWGTVAGSLGLLIVTALALILAGKRRAYIPVATAIGACGAVLIACAEVDGGEILYVAIYAALYTLAAALLSLLLFIPTPKRRKKDKVEKMHDKFRLELTEEPFEAEEGLPPKVCCFEEPPASPLRAEELRLSHVSSLIEKLRASKLSATDRLELDALSHTVDGYKGRPLSAQEADTLNDCLATVLKLTAKYKL